MPIIQGINFASLKTVKIPAWATGIRLVANAIDGYPPFGDGDYSIENFTAVSETVQTRHGAGEWDVLVYAVEDPSFVRELHPYGKDNPYRRLRGVNGKRVRWIAHMSYMRWMFYKFEKTLETNERNKHVQDQKSQAQ